MKFKNLDSSCKDFMNEAYASDKLPNGYYVVQSTTNISPGGGWNMTIRKGQLYKNVNEVMHRWSPLRGDWILWAPPIQGRTTMSFRSYDNGDRMLRDFMSNTKKISEAEAEEIKQNMVASQVFKDVKSAIIFLQKMPKNSKIKIEVVK